MKYFLDSEAEFLPIMMWVDQQAAHVSEEEFAHHDQHEGLELNTEWLIEQLYRVLSLNLEGLALAVVKNLPEEAKTRGINAWVEITKHHLVVTGQRMACLVARVFKPKRVGKYADAMRFGAGWESAVRQFERGAKNTRIDCLKICGLKQVDLVELEKDMNRQTSTLTTYDEFNKYAMDQVALRKEPHLTGTGSTASGPRPMEVDALHNRDFSYDQTHRVFRMHHEIVGDQLDAQGLTDGNEQVAGEPGLCAISKGKKKARMYQFSMELVTTADSSDTSWSIVPKRMMKCSSFDPRRVNRRDGRDKRRSKEQSRE